MARKAASKDAMRELHLAVARALTEGLAQQTDPETGAVLPPDPRILANAIAFLKNNGIVSEDDSPELQDIKRRSAEVLRFPFDPTREAAG